MANTLLIAGAVAGVGFLALGTRETIQTKQILENLEVKLEGITKLPEVFGTRLRAKVDISLTNKTRHALAVDSGGAVRITRVVILDQNNNIVGTANTDIQNINLLPFGQVILRNVEVEGNLLQVFNTLITPNTTAGYQVYVDVVAFGQRYTV